MNNAENKRTSSLSKESLVKTNVPNYNSIDQPNAASMSLDSVVVVSNNREADEAAQGSSTSIVLCVHGNRYGFTRCCDYLHEDGDTISVDRMSSINGSQKHLVGSSISASGGADLGGGQFDESYEDMHCHVDRQTGIDKKARNKLILASILCIVFVAVEAVGGYLAHSLAIATDAAHLLTDFLAFMISLIALWMGSRKPTESMSFGWHRAEVMGALISVMLIWVMTGILCYMAVERIIYDNYEIDAKIMTITSALALGFNIMMAMTLRSHGHSHGGGGGHGHDHEQENINVRAALIHVIGDICQSVGVLAAAIIIWVKPEWKIADPICTFIFSVIVCITTLRILKDAVAVLMEGTPPGIKYADVQETFRKVPGIVDVHNLRVWALTTDKNALVAHLAIEVGVDAQEVLKMASRDIRRRYQIYDMTLQVEPFQQVMGDCNQCQNP